MPGSEPATDGRRWATYGRRKGLPPERSPMVNVKGAPGSMRTHRYLALTALLAVVVGACSSPAASTSPSAASAPPAASATAAASTGSAAPSASASAAESPSASPLAADPKEAVIPNVEQGAKLTFWT